MIAARPSRDFRISPTDHGRARVATAGARPPGREMNRTGARRFCLPHRRHIGRSWPRRRAAPLDDAAKSLRDRPLTMIDDNIDDLSKQARGPPPGVGMSMQCEQPFKTCRDPASGASRRRTHRIAASRGLVTPQCDAAGARALRSERAETIPPRSQRLAGGQAKAGSARADAASAACAVAGPAASRYRLLRSGSSGTAPETRRSRRARVGGATASQRQPRAACLGRSSLRAGRRKSAARVPRRRP